MRGGYPKQNCIVSKQGVVDGRNSIVEGEARKRSFSLESSESSAKGVNNQDIKKMGERAPLPYPLGGFKKFRGFAID